MLSKIINIMSNKTLTITFCEKAENHVGMQIIGNQVDNGGFQLPDLIEYKRYFEENGYSPEIAGRAYNYYAIADWHDSKGNKIKNWKQKMQAVWFKEENKLLKAKISELEKENKRLEVDYYSNLF